MSPKTITKKQPELRNRRVENYVCWHVFITLLCKQSATQATAQPHAHGYTLTHTHTQTSDYTHTNVQTNTQTQTHTQLVNRPQRPHATQANTRSHAK